MTREALPRGVVGVSADPWPRRRRQLRRWALHLALLVMALAALAPFSWMVSTSLMTRGETITRQWLPAVPQVQNYSVAWTEGKFGTYLVNSVVITVTTL